jgi:inhibitor of KinA
VTLIRPPLVVEFGDSGVLVELGGEPGPEMSRRLLGLSRKIAAATSAEAGWGRPVPAATSVLVPVDPVEPGSIGASARIRALLGTGIDDVAPGQALGEPAPIEIPVRYGGADGPDLEAVAAALGWSTEAVVEAHSGPTYTALFLGFAPGFAYLGPLDPRLVVARRDVPREHVPAGSVAIAGPQTAVYPVDSPGGWWIIGRTPFQAWDPTRDPAAAIHAGARVRFVPERG